MADTTAYDLAGFPAPQVVEEVQVESIIDDMITDFEGRMPSMVGIVGLESEPTTKNIQVCAAREAQIRARVNDAARANLLKYATGTDLDNLAVFYDVVRMTGEDDDRLKLRVILAIQGRSPGGTKARYRKIALDSSIRVADAEVYREGTRPTVKIAVYSTDGNGMADADLLSIVREAVSAPDKIMVSDTIVVSSAVFQTVNVVADIWLLPEASDALLTPPAEGVESPLAASLRTAWVTEAGLGFDLVPEWVSGRLMVPGVQRAVSLTPASPIIAAPQNAISIGTITLNNRGRAY
ncbi:baseplate J/gp47 family protein [Bosea massiliensis]|uniref:Baseplate J/gp47 family protein n=1 Tax=Bosea massiliensis TaxID=151419 RepID=A0ABW0PBU5_9HYPH